MSTDEQYGTHLSIDDQRRRIIEAVERDGGDLGPNNARLGEEAASAYKLRFDERPLGARLNANMVRGDHIYIAKLDRAFRDMLDAVKTVEFWINKGIVVHILDMPFSGQPIFDKLILGILAWCAEFESHRKSERILDAHRAAARAGCPIINRAPRAFRWAGSREMRNKRLAYFPEEREHMTLMYELWMEHNLSTHEIASYFLCHQIKPFDKRYKGKERKMRLPIADAYPHSRIHEMIRVEAEMRYYEAQGKSPEEAAKAWLHDWGHDCLPEKEEVERVLFNGSHK